MGTKGNGRHGTWERQVTEGGVIHGSAWKIQVIGVGGIWEYMEETDNRIPDGL